jgi:hypothetical protein
MDIKILKEDFAICKIAEVTVADFKDPFCFLSKTDEEISLVCTEKFVPLNTLECDLGWKAFRIQGELDFSLVGILSKISTLLAEQKIGIFAISTYNTVYILTKKEQQVAAIKVLKDNGYEIVS